MRTPAIVLASLVLAAPAAHAGPRGGALPAPPPPPPPTFEALAGNAETLTRADLLGLAWATSAPCTDGDDAEQRLCRAVRDRRLATVRAGTYLIDGDSGALAVSEWTPADKLVTISVAGCMACVDPPGDLYVVSSAAAPTFQGAVASGANVYTTSITLADAVTAKRFRARVPALRTQFVVRVPGAAGGLWTINDKRGLALDVLAARVYDPCDGSIIVSTVPSGNAPADASTCPAQVETTHTERHPDQDLPESLTSKEIRTALAPVVQAAGDCYDAYGVMGKAKLTYTVAGDGSVTAYEQQGDFVDTPTGTCIDKAARAVTFPRTKKRSFTFSFPVSVQ
ncbi:MAG TPA: hypothetical protein VHE35_36705 [Kofleriaceae bacterium]|nr:hypothetical protein [Kofleriaceae bacterium]